MTRQWLWLAVAVIATLVLGAAWFLSHFDQVPVTRHEAARPEARRNPYLALERFLARLGRPVERIGEARALDRVEPGGVLILDRNRRRQLDGERVARLLAWVEAGGYLLVNAEQEGIDDPLLQRLGVRWRTPSAGECRDDDAPGEAALADSTARDGDFETRPIGVQIPGSARSLALESSGAGLQATTPAPAWSAQQPGAGAALLHFGRGRGQITVLADLGRIADNRRIGRGDHAEIIWSLLQHYQPAGRVLLATRLALPTLGEWLLDSAWMVLLSAGLLLGAWLWRIVPRFGGLVEAPPVERRSLAEHLAAMGRCVARAGGLPHWLGAVRGALHARLALRHPGIAGLAPAEQVHALAHMSQLAPDEVRFALTGTAASRAEFKRAVITLQRLEHLL